jgi:hypothetical protein
MAQSFRGREPSPRMRSAGTRRSIFRSRNARSRGARDGRRVHPGRCRRLGALAARRGADLRGARHGLPDGRGLYLHPQHGGLDDRPLRRGRAAPEWLPKLCTHGVSGELLPDRAGRGLGRGGADHARRARGRHYVVNGVKAVHLGRGRLGPLRHHGAHREGGRVRHLDAVSRRTRRASPSGRTRKKMGWNAQPTRP